MRLPLRDGPLAGFDTAFFEAVATGFFATGFLATVVTLRSRVRRRVRPRHQRHGEDQAVGELRRIDLGGRQLGALTSEGRRWAGQRAHDDDQRK